MTAAHGGQVLLSADTASLVPSMSTWNLGPFLLKDIEGPVELHQLRHDDLQTNFPAVRGRAAGRRAFPDELAAEVFVGRTLELQWLQSRGTKPGRVPQRGTRRWGGGHRQDQPGGEAGGWRLRRGAAVLHGRSERASPSRISPSAKHCPAGRRTHRTRNWLRWSNAGSASLRVSPGAHRSLRRQGITSLVRNRAVASPSAAGHVCAPSLRRRCCTAAPRLDTSSRRTPQASI